MFIEMKVLGLTIDQANSVPIVVLQDVNETITLPIYIGYFEAGAIATQLQEDLKPARPMTHDLIMNFFSQLGVKILHVDITEVKDDTFYAIIHLEYNNNVVPIDARPSDAIALALRAGAPIRASDVVLKQAGQMDKKKDKLSEYLESLDPDAFGKYKM
jgi:hypothetical protein